MRFLRLLLPTAILLPAMLLASATYTRPTQAAPSCSPAETGAPGPAAGLTTAINATGFHLYKRLAAGGGNVLISPLSIELALAMAYDGAHGSTATAMARTLDLPSLDPANVPPQAAALLADLSSADPKVQLAVANSLWLRQGIQLRPAFLHDVAADFGAQPTTLDFNAPSAPATINSWVTCATHGHITHMIGSIPAETILYLLNAVYFDGQWSTAFDPRATHRLPFTTGAGKTVAAPLMQRLGTYPYYNSRSAQIVSLPYGTGRFVMTIVLPHEGVSLAALRAQLTPSRWATWLARQRNDDGSVSLPRFTIHENVSLNAALTALGMGSAFGSHADFSRMCYQQCRISAVQHATTLQVDERGTVASAVTVVSTGYMGESAPSFVVLVNRPFLLAIRDTETGALLFLGGITNPTG